MKLSKRKRKEIGSLLLFVAPFAVLFTVFLLYPLLKGVALSFTAFCGTQRPLVRWSSGRCVPQNAECYNLIPHNRLQRSTTLIGFIKAERKTLRSMTGKRTSLTLSGLPFSFLSRLSKLNNVRHDSPSFTPLVVNSILSPSSRTVNAMSLVKSTTVYRG